MINISFSGVNFNDPTNGLTLEETNLWEPPSYQREISEYQNLDGGVEVYGRVAVRRVWVKGLVSASSINELESRLDKLKRASVKNQTVITGDFGGVTRTWTGKYLDAKINRSMPSHVFFRLDFIVADPIGIGGTQTISSISFTNSATKPYTTKKTFYTYTSGSELSNYLIRPRFTISVTLTRAVDLENTISFGNPEDSDSPPLTLDATLADNPAGVDWPNSGAASVILDCRSRLITVGGKEVDYKGDFPAWDPLSSSFQLQISSDNNTTFSGTISGSFKHEYV